MIGIPSVRQILGVRIRLHYMWSIAFVLITIIVTTQFPEAYPLWKRVVLGLSGSLLFLTAIGMRQIAPIVMAHRRGIPVKSVTLFIFGGVSETTTEATLPALELLIGVTGLLSSLMVAVIFYVAYLILVITGSIMLAGLIQWLTFICFMLAFFHFIPGYPLDGGWLLRALLWRATGDYHRARSIAGWIGWGTGLLFAAGGLLVMIVTQQRLVGVVLAFVGWALLSAAVQSRRQTILRQALQGITARDIMSKECPFVTRQVTIGQLIRERILVTGQRYFLVSDGVGLQGIVTMRDIKRVPQKRWGSTEIGDIMTPVGRLKTAYPSQTAISLLEQVDAFRISQMPVLDGDKVIGVVARDSLVRLGKIRAELRK